MFGDFESTEIVRTDSGIRLGKKANPTRSASSTQCEDYENGFRLDRTTGFAEASGSDESIPPLLWYVLAVLSHVDELLRMFDELIIPAARLLDTVETKLKDVRLTSATPRAEASTVVKQTSSAIPLSVNTFNKQTQKAPVPLGEYKTVVYEESDLIEWGHNSYYQDHQFKQVMMWPVYSVGRGRG